MQEQARGDQSVQGVLLGQKPDAEANELEHRTSEPPHSIQLEQQVQLAVQYGPVCIDVVVVVYTSPSPRPFLFNVVLFGC